jgi:hypothetical protein
VHLGAGCLANDQQARARSGAQYRPRPEWQLRRAGPAGAHLAEQLVERGRR